MHIKKRLIAVVSLFALTAGVLYASTLEMNTEQEEDPGIQLSWFDRKDTIYFWYSDESLESFINSAAVTFGEREGIHVIPVLVSESEYLEAINQASVKEEQQMPDAYIIGHESLEKAYLAGLAVEIQDEAGVCGEDYFPAAALSAISYHGKQVAYPLSFETSALVYNETYLAEWARQTALRELTASGEEDEEETAEEISPEDVDETLLASKTEEYFQKAVPKTVDDILTIADTFDLPDNVEGVMKWAVSDIFYNYWIVGEYMVVGGDAGDDEDNININNPETISCLEVYRALNQFFFIEADTVTYESTVQDFIDGKSVFTVATTDVVKRLEQAKQEGTLGFDYGIAMMPDVSGELKSRSMSVTNTVAINGYSRHKEMANKFAAYLVDECAGSLYRMTGKVSANLYADADNGALQIFKMEYAESIPLPKMMSTGNFWLLLERLFAIAWEGVDVTALTQELEILISFQTDTAQ